MIYFYKGFGLKYEQPSMQESKRIADELHKNGIKVGPLHRRDDVHGNAVSRTAEAQNWEQRNQDNHRVPYGLQTFRHYACPNEPKYRDYLKRILKIGVEDLHADQIVFDNIMLQPEPDRAVTPDASRRFMNSCGKNIPRRTR